MSGGQGGYHPNMRPWTASEDAIILNLHERMGPRWKKIAAAMPDRTVSSIRNRFQRIQRGVRALRAPNKSKKQNLCVYCKVPRRGHSCWRIGKVDTETAPEGQGGWAMGMWDGDGWGAANGLEIALPPLADLPPVVDGEGRRRAPGAVDLDDGATDEVASVAPEEEEDEEEDYDDDEGDDDEAEMEQEGEKPATEALATSYDEQKRKEREAGGELDGDVAPLGEEAGEVPDAPKLPALPSSGEEMEPPLNLTISFLDMWVDSLVEPADSGEAMPPPLPVPAAPAPRLPALGSKLSLGGELSFAESPAGEMPGISRSISKMWEAWETSKADPKAALNMGARGRLLPVFRLPSADGSGAA